MLLAVGHGTPTAEHLIMVNIDQENLPQEQRSRSCAGIFGQYRIEAHVCCWSIKHSFRAVLGRIRTRIRVRIPGLARTIIHVPFSPGVGSNSPTWSCSLRFAGSGFTVWRSEVNFPDTTYPWPCEKDSEYIYLLCGVW